MHKVLLSVLLSFILVASRFFGRPCLAVRWFHNRRSRNRVCRWATL